MTTTGKADTDDDVGRHFDGLRDDCDDIAKNLDLLNKLSEIAEIADFLEGRGSCAVASCS